MELCLLHANCQGEPLEKLLGLSPEFSSRWHIKHVVNYMREGLLPDELAACTLFLYQYLGPQWGNLSSSALLERVNHNAKALCIPNLFFKGYWPLWTHESSMNFGDICLDYLVDKGLSPAEAVHLYRKDSFILQYGLDALVEESQNLERKREANSIINLVDYVEAHWKEQQLFATVNHPNPVMMRLIANAILENLGMEPLPELENLPLGYKDLSCDSFFELPIHPVVGRHFNLPFVDEKRTYPAYGRQMTFYDYALAYADCRSKKLNLLDYLQGVVE